MDVKVQERLAVKPIVTAGHQAISTPFTERDCLRSPPEAYLRGRETELQATLAPIWTNEPTKAQSSSHNPEKVPSNYGSRPAQDIVYDYSKLIYATPEDDGHEDQPKEHVIWIWIYLSALSPLVVFPTSLLTMLMGTLLLLLLSLCFCLEQSAICARFQRLLSPLLVFQLDLIYSSCDINEPVQTETSGITVLMLVSMLSPLYSMAIALATWVAGIFWFYTAILGNPDGKEDRDDGREAVLAVRGWWEKWLIQSFHSPLRDSGSESGC